MLAGTEDVQVGVANGDMKMDNVIEMLHKLVEFDRLSDSEKLQQATKLAELRLPAGSLTLTSEKIEQSGVGKVNVRMYNGHKVAVKQVLHSAGASAMEAIENKMLIHRLLGNHPCILTLYDFVLSPGKVSQIVMDQAPLGSLVDLLYDDSSTALTDISLELSLSWLRDIAVALSHMHAKGIKYRDVKAENCLVFNEYKVRLCDFGLAKNTITSTVFNCGTEGFKAPVIKLNLGSFKSSDVYSWAVTAVQIFTCHPPTRASVTAQIGRAMTDIRSKYSPSGKFVNGIETLLLRCVAFDMTGKKTPDDLVALSRQEDSAGLVSLLRLQKGDVDVFLNVCNSILSGSFN